MVTVVSEMYNCKSHFLSKFLSAFSPFLSVLCSTIQWKTSERSLNSCFWASRQSPCFCARSSNHQHMHVHKELMNYNSRQMLSLCSTHCLQQHLDFSHCGTNLTVVHPREMSESWVDTLEPCYPWTIAHTSLVWLHLPLSTVNWYHVNEVSFGLCHVLREEGDQFVKQFCPLAEVLWCLCWNKVKLE